MSSIATIAPLGKFRVVRWQGAERHITIMGDFDHLPDARKKADELLPDSFNVTVFNEIGRCVYNARFPSNSANDLNRPFRVTRLAGFRGSADRTRSYKRR